MTTIPDDVLEWIDNRKKEKRSKPLAFATASTSVIPNHTKHYSAILKHTQNHNVWLKQSPDFNVFTKEFKQKLAAAHLTNQLRGDVILYSENEFKKSYEQNNPGHKVYDGLEDPLDDHDKTQMHENFRREGASRRAVTFISNFMLGDRTKISIDVNEGYADPKEEEEKVKLLNQNVIYRQILNQIATIDKNVSLFDRLDELIVTAHVYGRAVMVKQYDNDGIIVNLVPLFSLLLGKVYVDSVSHELLGVEYKDYEGEERILKAEDIIYYTVDDFPITPNSKWFGLSPMEPVMSTATSNRITMDVAIGEIVKRMWAKARIIKAPSIHGQTKLDDFAKKIKPGKDIIINQADIEVTTLDLDADIEKLMKSVEEREKKIFRDLTIPLVIAFQDEQNRSTAQYALHQWTESVLKHKRTKLRNVIEEQYYRPLLKKILVKRQIEIEKNQEERNARIAELESLNLAQQAQPILSQPQPTPGFVPAPTAAINTTQPAPSTSQSIDNAETPGVLVHEETPDEIEDQEEGIEGSEIFIDPENPPFRVKMTFDNIIFDTFVEKAAATLGFLEAGAITKEIALELAGVGQEFIDKMKAFEAQKEAEALAGEAVDMSEVPDLDTTAIEDAGGPGGIGSKPSSLGLPSLPIAKTGASSVLLDRNLQLAQIRRRQQLKRVIYETVNIAFKKTLEKYEHDKRKKEQQKK